MKGGRRKYSLKATIYDKRGRVLSVGKNSYQKTHPIQYHYAKRVGREDAVFLHAEMAALIKLEDTNKAYRIHIERYGSDGEPRPAEPCEICRLALEESGIKVIEFT